MIGTAASDHGHGNDRLRFLDGDGAVGTDITCNGIVSNNDVPVLHPRKVVDLNISVFQNSLDPDNDRHWIE